VVAACLAAVIAVFPATVSAATASWTIVPSPHPSGTNLPDVTCVGANDCWAVGGRYNSSTRISQPLIEHNTGSGWVIVPSPYVATDGGLSGVTCLSANDCWAVGVSYNSSTGLGTLIEHYNGIGWTIVSSPSPGLDENRLLGVKCVSTSNCWAVGMYKDTPGGERTLIEQYTGGNWVLVDTSLVGHAFLSDVTCLSLLGDCWAVGISFEVPCTSTGCTLIEHNTGNGWVRVASPNVPTAYSDALSGATCVSATDCWAVGNYAIPATVNSAGKAATLTEHYDGNGWTIVASPNAGFRGSVLSDVSCATAGDCWAVGYRVSISGNQTLIEHNTGSGWFIVKNPNTTARDNFLSGVKCVSTHACWAVGHTNSPDAALVEHHG
jgi:hypothetical protein